MTQAFSRSLRSLDAEPRWLRRFLGGLGLVAAATWCAWFFLVPLRVAATVEHARIEAAGVGHHVQASVNGMVTHSFAELGAQVQAGDVLWTLDTSDQEREQLHKQAEVRALQVEQTVLERRIQAVQRALDDQRQASRAHVDEAMVLKTQAESLADLGTETRQRKEALGREGALSRLDVLAGIAEDEQKRTRAVALGAAARRVEADGHVREAERGEVLTGLERELSVLRGKQSTTSADLVSIAADLERRRVRAPISGRLGDVLALTAGTLVHAGDTLATIIPAGNLRIIAQFGPAEALGRIRPGQSAELRLDGFPWTAFGSVPACVSQIAQEVRDGSVRVELALGSAGAGRIPLEHGMPGSVRIQVEETSAATLLWRAAGRAVSRGVHRQEQATP